MLNVHLTLCQETCFPLIENVNGSMFWAVYKKVIHLVLSTFRDKLFSDSQQLLLTLFSSFDIFSSTLILEKSSRLK